MKLINIRDYLPNIATKLRREVSLNVWEQGSIIIYSPVERLMYKNIYLTNYW